MSITDIQNIKIHTFIFTQKKIDAVLKIEYLYMFLRECSGISEIST